jgi:hypothetical protein
MAIDIVASKVITVGTVADYNVGVVLAAGSKKESTNSVAILSPMNSAPSLKNRCCVITDTP